MPKKKVVIQYLAEFPNYLSYLVFSAFITSPSPILIEIGETFNADPKDLSLIFSIFAIGGIIGRVISFFLRKRFKILNIIITSYLLLIVFIILLSQLNNISLFFVIYFFSGLLLGLIMVMSNELLLESYVDNKNRLLTIATTFFPVGSVITPVLITTMVKNGLNWKYMYYIILCLVVFTLASYIQVTSRNKYSLSTKTKRNIRFKEIFKEKSNNIIFLFTTLLLTLYIISEFIVSQWSPTFLRIQKLFEIRTVGVLVSVFWLAIILGRFIVSFVVKKINSYLIIIIISSIAIISVIFLVVSDSYIAALIAIIFAGLGFSSIFPILFSAGSTIYEKGRGMLSAIMLLTSGIGSSLAPYLTQVISKKNIIWSMLLAVVFMGIIIIITIFLIFYEKQIVQKSNK